MTDDIIHVIEKYNYSTLWFHQYTMDINFMDFIVEIIYKIFYVC